MNPWIAFAFGVLLSVPSAVLILSAAMMSSQLTAIEEAYQQGLEDGRLNKIK